MNTDDIPAEIVRMERELRSIGQTPTELCRRCGFHINQWIRWRNGETEPRMRTWNKVVSAFSEMGAPR